jgi:predicted alpha/beta-hydrolase family hydrolase
MDHVGSSVSVELCPARPPDRWYAHAKTGNRKPETRKKFLYAALLTMIIALGAGTSHGKFVSTAKSTVGSGASAHVLTAMGMAPPTGTTNGGPGEI